MGPREAESQQTLWGDQTGADLYTQIQTTGYALLPHHTPPEVFDAFAHAYATFTDELPDPDPATMDAMILDPTNLDILDRAADRQAEWHKYRTNIPHPGKPNGYTNRAHQAAALRDQRGLDITEDPKEYFHYSPGMRAALRAQHDKYNWGPLPPELLTLLFRADTVHQLAAKAMSGFFAKLELIHPELVRFTRPQDLAISPIRGAFYYAGQGDTLAGDHYDRKLCTFQLAESHLGLRTKNPQTGQMDLVQRDPDLGIVFPALGWPVAVPNSPLQPLWHGVTNEATPIPGRTLYGKNIARWAVIWFTNSEQLIDPDSIKEQSHAEATD